MSLSLRHTSATWMGPDMFVCVPVEKRTKSCTDRCLGKLKADGRTGVCAGYVDVEWGYDFCYLGELRAGRLQSNS